MSKNKEGFDTPAFDLCLGDKIVGRAPGGKIYINGERIPQTLEEARDRFPSVNFGDCAEPKSS